MKRTRFIFILAVSSLLLFSCGIVETEPKKEVRFNFIFEQGTPSRTYFDLGMSAQAGQETSALSKALHEYNQALVLVIDLSKYGSWDVLNDTPELAQLYAEQDSLKQFTDQLDYWDGWVEHVGRYFKIVANQSLEIGEDHATGYVPGVLGLNHFFVALCKDDYLLWKGEMATDAEPGVAQTVKIPMDYYNSLP